MNQSRKSWVLLQFGILVALVVAVSFLFSHLWGGKPEAPTPDRSLLVSDGMTVGAFGEANDLPSPLLKEVFHLQGGHDLDRKLRDFGFSEEALLQRINKLRALAAERESKNWLKILIKFGLWFIFLVVAFIVIRKGRATPKTRKWLYLTASVLFGVILGSDPSPMGTVKDAIVLYAAKGAIFPPRIIALSVFLLTVLLANKFICSWGCQFGALQDLIFRLNRNAKDTKGVFRQFKIPFVITNGIRAAFFILVTTAAFLWATDIVEPIDPFRIFKPGAIGLAGFVFLVLLLAASLFVYHPWCHLFCVFGLTGWLVEKLSVFKICVNYDTCEACQACAKACPSTAMGAILRQDRVIPDCFSCGTCVDLCPTDSIRFSAVKRSRPPEDHFLREWKKEESQNADEGRRTSA